MKIGDKIFFIEYKRNKGYGALQSTTVTKVGTKYFEVADNYSYNKIPLSLMVDRHESNDHKRYFLTEKDYNHYFEAIKLKSKIREFANGNMDISIDSLRLIAAFI